MPSERIQRLNCELPVEKRMVKLPRANGILLNNNNYQIHFKDATCQKNHAPNQLNQYETTVNLSRLVKNSVKQMKKFSKIWKRKKSETHSPFGRYMN